MSMKNSNVTIGNRTRDLPTCSSESVSISSSSSSSSIISSNSSKGKAIHVQAWTDPEDSRKLRLPDFMKIGT